MAHDTNCLLSPAGPDDGPRLMGPLLAVFIALTLNLVPPGVDSLTIDSYVVEGVGIYPDATTFLLSRQPEGVWQVHDAFGEPWFLVAATGPILHLADPVTETSEDLDLRVALGLPDEEWWVSEAIRPPGLDPLMLTHHENGVDVHLLGDLAAEIRW
jgi:hypothetical protein